MMIIDGVAVFMREVSQRCGASVQGKVSAPQLLPSSANRRWERSRFGDTGITDAGYNVTP
jgi:hypothetical protein